METFIPIASTTLSSSAASVTITGIPSTYKDLVLRITSRTDRASNNADTLAIQYNGNTSTVYSTTRITGTGSAAASARQSSSSEVITIFTVGSTATSNTFGNAELYIPSYGSSNNKPSASFSVSEDNNTTAYISGNANLFSNTTAVGSILIKSVNAANFVAGSTFDLYGIV